MVDPKDEPGFEPKHTHPEYPKKNNEMRPELKNRWRTRMKSNLIRMSRGAQNFWGSLSWPHKENWRRRDKKK